MSIQIPNGETALGTVWFSSSFHKLGRTAYAALPNYSPSETDLMYFSPGSSVPNNFFEDYLGGRCWTSGTILEIIEQQLLAWSEENLRPGKEIVYGLPIYFDDCIQIVTMYRLARGVDITIENYDNANADYLNFKWLVPPDYVYGWPHKSRQPQHEPEIGRPRQQYGGLDSENLLSKVPLLLKPFAWLLLAIVWWYNE